MLDLGKLRDIDALKLSLASASDMLSWSYGEVTKPETINYRSFKPEKGGLFCEQIFGPVKDYECYCGKYKRIRYKGLKCDRCGVQVTTSKVRRERMGHITLASPVAHVWFFKNVPSKLATLIGISPRSLDMVIYFSSFIITDIDYDKKKEVLSMFPEIIKGVKEEVLEEIELKIKTLRLDTENNIKNLKDNKEPKLPKDKLEAKIESLNKKMEDKINEIRNSTKLETEKKELSVRKIEKKLQEVEYLSIISDTEYIELEEYIYKFADVQIGAEAVLTILNKMDLKKLSVDLTEEMGTTKSLKYKKLVKRVKLIDTFIRGGVDPKSMIVTTLPVIPPDLRPMVMLEGGRYATSDLNDLYRRIINRNNRLKRLNDLGAPSIIVRNEKRMLQESVDALFDSSKVRKTRNRGRKEYRSIADAIKGKSGYFRSNLLGKRVDYSGRAVIVAGPDLKIEECGLPNEMALELFRPFVIKEVMARGLAPNMKTAKYVIEERGEEVWAILEEVVKNRPVLLNRAPTLHRLSIQAFYPKLTSGKAIQLHPVVCDAFNADFDGDQMSVHVPLAERTIKEAENLMLSTKNLLKPADGSVIMNPSKDMILGIYYLTSINEELEPSHNVFTDIDEANKAFSSKVITLRQKIKLQMDGEIVDTTVGRLIFNEILPIDLRFVNKPITKKEVRVFINYTLEKLGIKETVDLIDNLKTYGFKYATISGISLSIFDCAKPKDLDEVLGLALKEIESIDQNYQMGLITEAEKRRLEQRIWQSNVIAHFDSTILDNLDNENPVKIIIMAGASKASAAQLRQISGLKGLVADPSDRILDLPILGNYSTGMSSFDYFLTNRGVRKTYMDKGLGTADAGYLTRRLVNVAQNILIREKDCGTNDYMEVSSSENAPLVQWHQRIIGRVAAMDIKIDKKVIVKQNEVITEKDSKQIANSDLSSVKIFSPLTCTAKYGVCAKCYGIDLTNNKPVELGLAVGIIAAQSIGEPGTQLTMRTFHSGGIVGQNITQGLPRVEELFEARNPKSSAILSEVSGKVRVNEDGDIRTVIIEPNDKELSEVVYKIEAGMEILTKDGDIISEGTAITTGYMPLQNLYKLKGPRSVQKYIINEIQTTYGAQGVSINDKHIEVIVKQMFNRVMIIDEGDTKYLSGDTTTVYNVADENDKIKKSGGKIATYEAILTGITKASRMSESWLDAASFEQTSAVLTDGAIEANIDRLIGLKENVIIGRRIPIGEEVMLQNLEHEKKL